MYEWAGQYRKINIQKREKILAGKSVWYSDNEDIEKDLETAWKNINAVDWAKLSKEEFAKNVARLFPAIWQVHPFREGNTRTVVMLITFLLSITAITLTRSLYLLMQAMCVTLSSMQVLVNILNMKI